jgi:hypothetical protein
MYDVLDALEACLQAANPAKREALAMAIDGYARDFHDEFFWATGAQSPTLLHNLLMVIDAGCRPAGTQSMPRVVLRLVDRKPGGKA